jgi:heterogeneous nuclear ribonucleoprotein F/H
MAVSLANKVDCAYTGVLKLRGLPFQATVADVQEFFSGFGVVNHGIYITTGPDGRATGAQSACNKTTQAAPTSRC